MNWAEIVIHTTSVGAEIMAEILLEADAAGAVVEDRSDLEFNQGEYGDWDYIDPSVLNAYSDEVLVKGYLPDDERLFDRVQYLHSRIEDIKSMNQNDFDVGSGKLDVNMVHEENWANEWKKYFKPFKVGNRIIIKPAWEDYEPEKDDLVLVLNPGMAFGTGSHETTRLCLEMIEKVIKPGMSVIDVGCGTGILGIAAALLGAQPVIAIDRDPVCIKSSLENIKLNHLENIVTPFEGDLLKGKHLQADLIVINIIADVVIELLGSAGRFLKENGLIICSGIIKERLNDVLDAAKQNGFDNIEVKQMGEWAAVQCRKR